jgi:hypothetical protein
MNNSATCLEVFRNDQDLAIFEFSDGIEVVYCDEVSESRPNLTERMETVERALGIRPKRTKLEWTRDHWLALSISAGTIALIVIAFLSWWQPQWKAEAEASLANTIDNRIASKLAEPLKQLQQIQIDVAKVSTKLDTFIDLEKERLNKLAQLPPAQFRQHLPDVKNAVEDAIALDVPAPDNLHLLQQNLIAIDDERGPDYWNTVALFASYRSRQMEAEHVEFLLTTAPLCKDVNFHMEGFIRPPSPHQGAKTIFWTNCVVSLEEELKLTSDPEGMFSDRKVDIRFRQCLVKYSGGTISHMFDHATFENCIFVFSSITVPTKRGQEFLRSLLRSTSSTVVVPNTA